MDTMIQFEELRLQLLEDEDALKELSSALGLEEMRKEVATLEEQTAADGFGRISATPKRCCSARVS